MGRSQKKRDRNSWLGRLFSKDEHRAGKEETKRRSAAKAYAKRMLRYDIIMAKRYEKAPSYVKEKLNREARMGRTRRPIMGVDMNAVKRYERLSGRSVGGNSMNVARRITGEARSGVGMNTARHVSGKAYGSFGANARYRKRY